MDKILWQPSKEAIEKAELTRLITALNSEFSLKLQTYQQLHEWSVNYPEKFGDFYGRF